MSFKPQQKKNNNNSSFEVDFEYIADQVDEGPEKARVAAVLDMGVHKQPVSVNDKGGFMFLKDEEELLELLNTIRESQGDSIIDEKGLDEYEEVEEGFMLPFKVVKDQYIFANSADDYSYFETEEEANEVLEVAKKLKGWKFLKDDQKEVVRMENCIKVNYRTFVPEDNIEFTVIFDLVETEVEYVKDSGEYKQYRLYMNSPFKGSLRGNTAPALGKTYSPNSKMAKLITACNKTEILDKDDQDSYNDISLLVNAPLSLNIEKSGSFVRYTGFGKAKAKDLADFPELQCKPLCVTFDNATKEMLQELKLRKPYLEKIKSALNYEGSAMQAAVEAYEASKEQEEDSSKDEPKEAETASEEATEAPKKTVKAKVTSTVKKPAPKEPEPEEEDEEETADDLPW